MLRCRMLSPLLHGRQETTYFLNVRWSTVSTDFDNIALAAAKPFEELPSMLSLPLIGTAWTHLPIIGHFDFKRFGETLLKKREIMGNIFREKFGPLYIVTSFNPDDLQTMYQHEGLYPVRHNLESVKRYRESRKEWYSTLGVSVLNGKEWHDLRSKTQKHLLKPKAIQAFLNPMQDVSKDLVRNVFEMRNSKKEIPDFVEELNKWALESVALVGLDTRLGCLQIDSPPDSDGLRMIKSAKTQFECVSKLESFSGSLQLWKYFPTSPWKEFVKSCDTFAEIASKHINRSMEKLKRSTDEDQDLTLLQSLIMTKGMDVSSAMVMVLDMLVTGIDTVSHTVGFFLYDIAKNQDKQEMLHRTLLKVLPRKEDRITPSVFNELRYLKACIKESQRLHPTVAAHARTADHDVVFSGYRIPAGTRLLIGVQGIYRDERYFSRPNEFLPERWLNKDEKIHPYAFLPFGFGVRSCIGRRLAELEMICLTTELIRSFRIEYHHEDVGMYTRLINVPDKPMTFRFVER